MKKSLELRRIGRVRSGLACWSTPLGDGGLNEISGEIGAGDGKERKHRSEVGWLAYLCKAKVMPESRCRRVEGREEALAARVLSSDF